MRVLELLYILIFMIRDRIRCLFSKCNYEQKGNCKSCGHNCEPNGGCSICGKMLHPKWIEARINNRKALIESAEKGTL